MFAKLHRDNVFVAGGQPSVTYVEREQLHPVRYGTRCSRRSPR